MPCLAGNWGHTTFLVSEFPKGCVPVMSTVGLKGRMYNEAAKNFWIIVLFNGERNENLLDGRFPVATSYAGWLNKNSQFSPKHISEQWFCHCGTKERLRNRDRARFTKYTTESVVGCDKNPNRC